MIIVVNKEKGITSRDVVNKLCKILNTKKIGHTGTLDPLASGVLVCLTDKDTKLVDIITSTYKEYVAEIKLGILTDTLDITGNITLSNNNYKLNNKDIIKVLNSFLGTSIQEVPKYSAVKINGKRLYEYARSNEYITLPKREIDIKEIELLEYKDDIIKFRVIVSKGTYIRSLIKDICTKLNVYGTMNNLIRTKQGNFKIEDSYLINDIENNNYKNIPLKDAINLKEIDIKDNTLYKKIINGNKLELNFDGYILFKNNNQEIALYNFINNEGRLIVLYI